MSTNGTTLKMNITSRSRVVSLSTDAQISNMSPSVTCINIGTVSIAPVK